MLFTEKYIFDNYKANLVFFFLKKKGFHVYLWREFEVIHQTRGRVFHHDIQTPRNGLKNEAQPSFFNPLQDVWISDETLFGVFDVAYQTDH